jgi:hypothetical protein
VPVRGRPVFPDSDVRVLVLHHGQRRMSGSGHASVFGRRDVADAAHGIFGPSAGNGGAMRAPA